jgi:hypothetical protein
MVEPTPRAYGSELIAPFIKAAFSPRNACQAKPELQLHLTAREPFEFTPDAAVQLQVADGW